MLNEHGWTLSAKVCSVFMSFVLAVGMTIPSTAFADRSDQSDGAVDAASSAEKPIDIADAWSKGTYEIKQGGDYFLSSDVQTEGTLVVSVPAGETAKIDFRGHSVKVKGVVSAGVDVSGSLGAVELTDSSFDASADQAKWASLTVEANKAGEVTCGVLANYAAATDSSSAVKPSLTIKGLSISSAVNTVDASASAKAFDSYAVYAGYADENDSRKDLDLHIENCAVSASLNQISVSDEKAAELQANYGEKVLSESSSGLAAGVFLANAGAQIAGTFSAESSSSGTQCGIYLKKNPGFEVAKGLTCSGVSVYAASGEGSAFATLAAGAEYADGMFVSASDPEGFTCNVEGDSLLLAHKSTAGQTESSSDSPSPSDAQQASVMADDYSVSLASNVSDDGFTEINQDNAADYLAYGKFRQGNHEYAYRLTDDIKLDKGFAGPSDDAGNLTIDLAGHTLTLGGAIYWGEEYAEDFSDLTIASSTENKGHIVFENNACLQILGGTENLTIDNVVLEKKWNSATGAASSSFGFNASNPDTTNGFVIGFMEDSDDYDTAVMNAEIIDSEIIFDARDVATCSSFESNIAAIYMLSGDLVDGLDLSNSTVACYAPDHLTSRSSSVEAGVNAYGLLAYGSSYESDTSTVNVDNVQFASYSPLGNAVAIGLDNQKNGHAELQLSDADFSLDSSVGQYALRASSDIKSGAIALNGKVSCSFQGTGTAAFVSSAATDSPLVISKGFSSASGALPLLIGSSEDLANSSGYQFATLASGFNPTDEERAALRNSFRFYDSDRAGGIAFGSNGLEFEAPTEENAAVSIVGSDGNVKSYYRKFAQANDVAVSGDTIKLNTANWNGSVVSFVQTAEEGKNSKPDSLSYSVDLNGADVGEFACSSKAKVTLTSSAEEGQTLSGASNGKTITAISKTSTGTLTVSPSIKIDVAGESALPCYAIMVTGGTLNLSNPLNLMGSESSDVSVRATSKAGKDAFGIYANGSGVQVNATGISVEAVSSGATANGLYLGYNASASFTNSSATAYSKGSFNNSGVAALYAYGSGTFTASNSVFESTIGDCSSSANYGAAVTASGSKEIKMADCSFTEVSATGAFQPKSEGAVALSVLDNKAPSLMLSGNTSFASTAVDADIVGLCSPLLVASSFKPASDSVSVKLASGYAGEFAERPAGDDENFTESQKGMFSVWLDGENWPLRLGTSGNVLELDRDVVAKIGDTEYYALSKAFEKAVDGDTIKLAADVSVKSALDLSSSTAGTNRSIALDLAGHTLTVAGSDIANAVVVPSNTGLTVIDSEKTGQLNLKCSANGFRVASNASLVLDSVNVDVQFNGKVNYVYGGREGVRIAGIAPGSTSWRGVFLKNGANLTVESQGASALASGNTGATQAYGISLPSSASGQMLSIDSTSSVKVNNSSQLLTAGSVSASSEDAKRAELRELNLDEGSELYNSIWDEFYKTAKYDKTKGIYYAAPLTVGNTSYWVLSEQVSDPTGTKDEVKPATIYVRGTYQVAPEAVGISSSHNSSSALAGGTVDVSGTVSAESENGNAFAVQASDSATWNVNDATLSAVSKAKGAYRGKTAENTSLYPSSQNPLIVDVAPQAAALKTSNSNQSFVLDGAVSISSSTAFKGEASSQVNCASADIVADTVTCGSSFRLKEEASPISVLAISGKNEQGSTFAKAAEGALSGKASLFADATGQYGAVVAADGALVWGGSYNVQFVDCYGNVVSQMADVTDGQTVALPDANKLFRDRDSEYVYTFLGWSTNKDAENADVSATDTTMEFASGGVAEQTITYYPVYSKAHHQTTVNFERLCSSDGQPVNGNGSISVEIDTGKTVKQAIDENKLDLSFAQSYSKEDGTKYIFVGWTTRGINEYDYVNAIGGYLDDGAMRTIELSANAVSDTTITLTANYVPVKSDQYLAKFKVGNIVFAQAVNVGAAPSWKENSGYKENTNNLNYPSGLILERVMPDGVSTLTFKGWHAGSSDSLTVPDGQKPDYTADDALKGAEAGGTVMYTAWFDTVSSTCAVKLCLYQQGADGKFYSTRTAYSTNGSDYYAATYGTEPSSIVKDLPKSFVQDGKTYTFKGWSVRDTDTEPIWEDGSLPTVTGSATYWAVYDVAEQKVNVTFMNGSETYKTLPGVEVSKSLDDMAVEAPQPADANQEFLGWNTQQGATSGMNATASLKDLLGGSLTADTTQVTFYAVYGEKSSYNVTMHYQFKDQAHTLSAKAYDDGTVVLPSDFSYENALVYGKYLAGWATTEGATEPDFDLSKSKVSGSTDLYAVYKDISVNATQGQGASIDASGAYVATQGAIGASDVSAKIVKADSIDKNLASKASGLLNRGNYTVSLGYSNGSESSTTQVNGNFGNLSISIPVASEDADRNFQVYWIQENGTFGGLSTSESTQVDEGKIKVEDDGQGGKVLKFSIGSYGDSMFGGNLMVCAEKTSLEKAQDNYLTQLKEYWNKLGGDNEEDGIQDNYSDDDFTKLKQAYENGEKAIKAATSEDEALATANEAVANLLAVPTRSTLQNAKAYALDKLADDFSGYNKSNYTDANWTQLEAAYKAAKENINNATTANDANSACNKGISAMASVSTKTDSDSGSASSGSGSSAASGSGLSSSGASGSGSGLASGSGSGLSGASGSGLESSSGSGLTSLGSTVQQMLGAKYETVTSDLVTEKGLIATSGVYVSEVTDGGAAQKAGLEVGDVITAVNGTQVSSVEELESVLADAKAGDSVEFTVDRNGKKLTLTATLDEASGLSSGLSTNSAGLGSSAVGSGSDTGSGADALKTLRDYLPWVVLGLLVLLAAVAGLVWWLLRRRNNGSEEELLETEGDADSQEDANTFQF